MMMMLKCFCWWCGHKMTTMDLISSPHHVVRSSFLFGPPHCSAQSLQLVERSDSHTAQRINCKKFSTAALLHTLIPLCGTEHACIYVAAASRLSTNMHCTGAMMPEHVDKFKSYKFYLFARDSLFFYCWKICVIQRCCTVKSGLLSLLVRLCMSTSYIHDIWKLRQPAAKQWNGEEEKNWKFLHRSEWRRRRNNMQNVYKLSLEGDWDFSLRLSYFRIYSVLAAAMKLFFLAFPLLLLVVVVCRLWCDSGECGTVGGERKQEVEWIRDNSRRMGAKRFNVKFGVAERREMGKINFFGTLSGLSS